MKCVLLLVLAAMAVAADGSVAFLPDRDRPNIVVVMVDDMGYSDVGFAGEKRMSTPALDRLAASGFVLERAYVPYSICTASRIGFHTGQYPNRHKEEISRNYRYDPHDTVEGLPAHTLTMAEHLDRLGYRTGLVGKWHMGSSPSQQPLRAGFDYFYGFASGGHSYWPAAGRERQRPYDLPIQENWSYHPQTGYLTDMLTDKAVGFVSRGGSEPFFLLLSYNAPHSPFERPPQEYLDLVPEGLAKDEDAYHYYGMIQSVDRGVDRVVRALRESRALDNTLIVFLNDNGLDIRPPVDVSDNLPLSRGKASVKEGGIRVPMFATWPDRWEGGRSHAGVVTAMDLVPTLVAAAGGDPAATESDGLNLLPVLDGDVSAERGPIYWFGAGKFAVIEGDMKLMQEGGESFKGARSAERPELALYDLSRDPGETVNLIAVRRERAAAMLGGLTDWCRDLNLSCRKIKPPAFLRIESIEDAGKSPAN